MQGYRDAGDIGDGDEANEDADAIRVFKKRALHELIDSRDQVCWVSVLVHLKQLPPASDVPDLRRLAETRRRAKRPERRTCRRGIGAQSSSRWRLEWRRE